jgi:chromosome partitioning protein
VAVDPGHDGPLPLQDLPERSTVTRIIAVTNQKGGVAKTTTTASLGVALAERGQRVLLVDLDPQACLTFSIGVDPEDLELSISNVLTHGTPAADVLLSTDEGVDLLPATIELAGAEAALLTRTGRELTLRMALEDLDGRYDWVFLDAPPSLGVLTVNALTAAREVLIPLQCETLSHRGVGQLLDTIHDVRRLLNPRLSILGVLPTLYDGRTTHARVVLADVSERYQLPIVEPPVPKSVRFAEAPAMGRSILTTSRRSKGAEAYREIARRLLGEVEDEVATSA